MTSGLGAFGEEWAVGHLTRLGYTLIERNVRFRTGELDIVAMDGDELVFVEVKCRRSSQFGTPEDSIDRKRFTRLATAIAEYLHDRALEPESYRVDVIALEVGVGGRVIRHTLLKGVEAPAH